MAKTITNLQKLVDRWREKAILLSNANDMETRAMGRGYNMAQAELKAIMAGVDGGIISSDTAMALVSYRFKLGDEHTDWVAQTEAAFHQ